MKQYCWLLVFIGALGGCQVSETGQSLSGNARSFNDSASSLPSVLQQALAAHGGLNQWHAQQLLEYDVYRQGQLVDHQLIALRTRKVLLNNDTYQIGYDGTDYWISPDTTVFESDVRFYHNLQFYFMALPFLFADPGIRYEVLEPRDFQGKPYDVLRITFEPGVGDSSDDEYVVYFDQESHQLTLLLYTVTYFSGEPAQQYNARWYQEWQEISQLLLPMKVGGYEWNDGELGKERYVSEYRNVTVDTVPPDESMFLAPTNAMVVE